jgi:hypothetical protein
MEETKNTYRILVGNPLRKYSQGRPRRIWQHSFRTDAGEKGCDALKCMELTQDSVQWWDLVLGILILLPG